MFCGRAVYFFKYKDPEFFKRLFGAIREINRTALDLPQEHKLDVQISEPEQPVLTGFQIVDSTRRMIFLEGPKETMALLASKVPRGRANSESFKVFANPNLGFGERLYGQYEVRIPTLKVGGKLDSKHCES